MNQIEPEDMTSDAEITQPQAATTTTTSGFVKPPYSFKGTELFPYTYGYELLFNQVRDPEDTGLYTWLAFVFLLLKQGTESAQDHRKRSVTIAWRVASFREALAEWMDNTGPFSPDDKLEAKRIYEDNMKAAIESSMEPVPGKGARTSQKKTHRKKQP